MHPSRAFPVCPRRQCLWIPMLSPPRSGPGAWPKLPGEHSTPPKQPPFRRHPVSEQEHDDYMTHAAGSGQDRIGGKSSNTQHRHGHEIDEGRQKRRRADPAPAIARPRVNGVEHNCSQNDGVQVHRVCDVTVLQDLMFGLRPTLWQCTDVGTHRFC